MYMFSDLFLLENHIICIAKISAQFILLYVFVVLWVMFFILYYYFIGLYYKNKYNYFYNITKWIMMYM